MESQRLDQARKRLRNRWPLVGTGIRCKAARELAADGSAEAVPLLIEALADSDAEVRATAGGALGELRERDAVDALCRAAVGEPAGAAAKICIEARKRPSDHEEACLLLFVTRQLEEYFVEDFEFQGLRQAYDGASDEVKTLVMDVVRGGDRRCLGFFGRRKPLGECNESEIKLAIESALKHRDWPRLFRAFQELPMKYGFPLLDQFRKAGWEPEQADLKSLYRAALAESDGKPLPPPPKETSPLFERWLGEGRAGEFSKLGEADLVQRLAGATPPDGVRIAAALATKVKAGSQAARAVEQSGHWLARLAGYATGLCTAQPDVTRDEADGNYWINELVRATPVLEFWPVKASPADLDKLNAVPREAFLGKYGAVRRVLRLLLAHRVTTPEMEEVVFDAGEFAGEFEEEGGRS
ncbi:MAG: HEAT repeat domain-containing protein [Bryobacterales bacterium]|nr:HEAT repeat domain-containing protein [Bryobacterales bacterium]